MMYNYNVYTAMRQLGVTQLRTKQSKVLSCILQNRDVLLYTPTDFADASRIIRQNNNDTTDYRGEKRLDALKKVIAEPKKAWKGIAKYFG